MLTGGSTHPTIVPLYGASSLTSLTYFISSSQELAANTHKPFTQYPSACVGVTCLLCAAEAEDGVTKLNPLLHMEPPMPREEEKGLGYRPACV